MTTMAGGQLPAQVAEFARYLRALTRRLDVEKGWYGVFAQRDPEGMRACLDGREVPPWDVVQALLQDLSAQRGPDVAQEAAARAAGLYRASVTAYDTTVGGHAALQSRLEAMLREQRHAAKRERELHAAVRDATAEDDTDTRERLATDLAWARDDWERATARCDELRARLTALDTALSARTPAPRGGSSSAGGRGGLAAPDGWFRGEAPSADDGTGAGGPRAGAGAAPRVRRPRGSRFATAYEGMDDEAAVGQEPADPGPYASGTGSAPAAGHGVVSRVDGARAADGGPGARVGAAEGPGGRGAPVGPDASGAGAVQGPGGPSAAVAGGSGEAGAAEGQPFRPRGARFAGAAPAGDAGGAPGEPAVARAEEATAAAGDRVTPRGARFAGAISAEAVAAPAGAGAEAGQPVTPRGARFAGAYEGGGDGARRRRRGEVQEEAERRAAREAARSAEARRAAAEAVERLARLRADGRGGEAHVLLCEAAAWPAPWLPLLAAELERAGLEADVATLLWEVACLPPAALAAAAGALVAAGRGEDGARLLRQGVARPVSEVAQTVLALLASGSRAEAAFLLEALVRARRPDEAAQAAAGAPAELVPLLLDAASGVSSSSHHDLAHALRVAGLPGVPGPA
ncbi:MULTISPECIES: hypothetical protein [unclassified Streptomyces]|uniref:hypothetical protein n=1 Tax=unclassified Streptomyces TaxID=2593676 RepID=UPI003369C3C9